MPEKMTLTNIGLVIGSPWQSRSTMDMVKLEELKTDIYTSRLHQPVVLRTVKGGYTDPDDPDSWTSVIYEVVSGHRRLEAFRQLHERGWQLDDEGHSPGPGVKEYWDGEATRIPAITHDMTDAEAARTILSENRMREDVNVMDEIRAVRRALDGTNVSAHDLAVSLGISDAQLSNRLRLLKLPEGLQDCVGAGKLAWTTARELLVFVGTDCDHSNELAFVERKVQDYDRSMPLSTLQQYMASARARWWSEWRRLTGRFEYWMDDEEPLFDVEEFKRAHKYWIHSLPMDSHRDSGNRLYTCAVEEFDRLQAEGERAIAEVEAAEREEEEGAAAPSQAEKKSGPTEAELKAFEREFHARCDAWDKAIKGTYDRLRPVFEAMDDGLVERQLHQHPGNAVKTWADSLVWDGEFEWRHGWHVQEILFLFGLPAEAPSDRHKWQMGSWDTEIFTRYVGKLDRRDKRELLHLVSASENAICVGRCGGEVYQRHLTRWCTGCSAVLIKEEEESAELQEASR